MYLHVSPSLLLWATLKRGNASILSILAMSVSQAVGHFLPPSECLHVLKMEAPQFMNSLQVMKSISVKVRI